MLMFYSFTVMVSQLFISQLLILLIFSMQQLKQLIYRKFIILTFQIGLNNQQYIIDKQQMNQNNDKQLICGIINRLYNHQQIDTQLLQNLSSSENKDFSCFIGLINLLYNLARQFEGVAQSNVQQKQKQNVLPGFGTGRILHLRGQILKQYAKFTRTVLFRPAYDIAAFQHQSFNNFCNDRGLNDLIRQTKGIFPVVDSRTKTPLHFLPYYSYLKQPNTTLIGNQNWKIARRILSGIYEQKKKRKADANARQKQMQQQSQQQERSKLNLIFPFFEEDSSSSSNTKQQKLKKGIQLFYMLLAEKYEELEQYIKQVEQQISYKAKQDDTLAENQIETMKIVTQRFRFWLVNYKMFMREGLEMYENQQDHSQQIPVVYECTTDNIEHLIIYLIQKLFQIIIKPNNEQLTISKQNKCDILEKMNKLVELIQKDKTITTNIIKQEQDQEQEMREQNDNPVQYTLTSNNKMFLLTFIHQIHSLIFGSNIQNQDARNYSKQVYSRLAVDASPQYQPYNRIFYTDDELLKLYRNGNLKQLPTILIYSNQLMSNILRTVIKMNSENLLKNEKYLNLLSPYQIINFIVKSKSLGDVSQLQGNLGNANQYGGQQFMTKGQRLLGQLLNQSQKFQNKMTMIKLFDLTISSKDFNGIIVFFISQWSKFYEYYKNFSLQAFIEILKKYEKIKNKSMIKNLSLSSQLQISDFILPFTRPDCHYHIINKFMQNLLHYKNRLFKLCQENQPQKRDSQQFQLCKKQIMKFIVIMKNITFKNMLSSADKDFVLWNDEQAMQPQQQTNDKQLFQDQLWKIYGQAVLLTRQQCRNMITVNNNQRSPQRNNFLRR